VVPAESLGVAVSCTVCPTRMLAVAGVTCTDATGTLVTVSVAVALLPSLVAVIVAVPGTTPVTSPLLVTVAMLELLLAHVTVRPVRARPAESCGVAVSCNVCPTRMLAVAGATATEVTGTGVTVIAAVLLLPSLVAVIVADPPSATSVTRPVGDTVATVGALDVHATGRPVSVLPVASLSVTVSCTVPLTGRVAVAGVTTTDATGTSVTVTATLPAFPSIVAVIVADPAAPPVTRPLVVTVATPVLLLVHVTGRPVSVVPAESCGVAVSCTVCPTCRLAVAGDTATDATGTSVTVSAAVALLPSLVAVIGVEPRPTPVTRPLGLTVATLVSPLAHV